MKTKMDEKQKEALVDRVIDVLHPVNYPEIPVDVYELGLIYNIEVSDKGEVYILMTMTTPNCPMIESLPQEIEEKIKAAIKGKDHEEDAAEEVVTKETKETYEDAQ